MILSDLKAYLRGRRRVPLPDLVNRFGVDAEALRGMLQQFERKGRVRRVAGGGECSGCSKCEAFRLEVYEWTD